MDAFENLVNQWQQQTLPEGVEQQLQARIQAMDTEVNRENTLMSYWLGGTIFFLGAVVLPFLNDTRTMAAVAGVMFLVGITSLLSWLRSSRSEFQMDQTPERYVDHRIRLLRYRLLFTNVVMPMYCLILAVLVSFYLYWLLMPYDPELAYLAIGLSVAMICVIFIWGWRRKYRTNQATIVPAIQQLIALKNSYKNKF